MKIQACTNFNNNGTCVTDCPPRKVYNSGIEQFENNVDFRFHSGSLCVESCPSKYSKSCNNTTYVSQVLGLNKEHFV